jgi:hypothetical protein
MSSQGQIYVKRDDLIKALEKSEDIINVDMSTLKKMSLNPPVYLREPDETFDSDSDEDEYEYEYQPQIQTSMEEEPIEEETTESMAGPTEEETAGPIEEETTESMAGPMGEETTESMAEPMGEEMTESIGEDEYLSPENTDNSNEMLGPNTVEMNKVEEEKNQEIMNGGRRTRRNCVSFADMFMPKKQYKKRTRRVNKNKTKKSARKRRKSTRR